MNDRLLKYYRSALSKFVWLITLSGVFIVSTLPQWLPFLGTNSIFIYIVRSLLSMGVVGGLYLAAEKLVRTRLWKLAYPELDFSGKWSGRTSYDAMVVAPPGGSTEGYEPFDVNHEISFIQDCVSISVGSTTAPAYAGGWRSIVAGFEKDEPNYAYRVQYKRSDRFPSEAIGFERLSIIDPQEGHRPVKLSGSFSHCAWDRTPVYSGTVSFWRSVCDEQPSLDVKILTWIAKLGRPSV